jgi:uncharacterized protein involved in exopolysaccharide biosynthesis
MTRNRRFLRRPLAALAAVLIGLASGAALAQAPDLFSILAQLQRNPQYAGRVLTTQQYYPDPGSPRFLYEVRILRPDDRIIIVYIDPANGRIVSVSGG